MQNFRCGLYGAYAAAVGAIAHAPVGAIAHAPVGAVAVCTYAGKVPLWGIEFRVQGAGGVQGELAML